MALCRSGILPLLACQAPRWRFYKVPFGIPCGSGSLKFNVPSHFDVKKPVSENRMPSLTDVFVMLWQVL
jgi:hypothetical protein